MKSWEHVTDRSDRCPSLDPIDGVDVLAYDPEQNLTDEPWPPTPLWCGVSPLRIIDQLVGAPNLRWIQTLTAGPDPSYKGFRRACRSPPDAVSTTRRSPSTPWGCALAGLRQIPESLAAQAQHRWAEELSGFRSAHDGVTLTTLIGARVTICGFGSIGQTVAARFAACGASVTGIARSAGERAGFPVRATADVDEVLTQTDVLVLVLPKSPETDNVLDARRLALLSHYAWVINVGRGNAIDETALAAALHEGTWRAGLDVFQTEPLPADSPLWDAPHVIITPHNAGGRPLHTREFITDNLHRLLSGEPLRNLAPR